jgi:hypothetical protein
VGKTKYKLGLTWAIAPTSRVLLKHSMISPSLQTVLTTLIKQNEKNILRRRESVTDQLTGA